MMRSSFVRNLPAIEEIIGRNPPLRLVDIRSRTIAVADRSLEILLLVDRASFFCD
jgi:hypothetical protein